MSEFMDEIIGEIGWKRYETWDQKSHDMFRWMDRANTEIKILYRQIDGLIEMINVQETDIKKLRDQIDHLSAVIDNIEGRLIEGGTL